MFTLPLRSNERGPEHRKHRSSVVAHVRFRGNVFTEPLPSNELFRLLGVMSQYNVAHSGERQPTLSRNTTPSEEAWGCVCYSFHASFLLGFNLEDEATCSSKASVYYHLIALRYIPEDKTLHNDRREKLESYGASRGSLSKIIRGKERR
jgi:hypothetical protein